ncbi:FAD-binding domain-containing protein [Jackrogersella minutella]|nr:FAD-binding domain-containing protein [Jackrogersella minutella]
MDKTPPLTPPNVPWPADTQVYRPGSDAFTNATSRWSIYEAPKFIAAVTPKDEDDVANIVKAARVSNIPILATGGRHGYGTTLGKLDGGLAIDLSQMNTIKIDEAAGTVTVGPGTKLGDVAGPIEEAGYELPIGSCSDVSVIGASIGAGIGLLQGLFGLMIDCLVSVRLVLANGDLVETSENTNSDLFWGIRGAGANFGIITTATYQLHKAVNNAQIFTADAIYPASAKSAYFDVLQSFENKMPAQLAIVSAIRWDTNSNTTQIIVCFVYSGTESEARQVLAPFLDLSPPVLRTKSVPYSQIQQTILFGDGPLAFPPRSIYSIFSVNVRRFAAETWKLTFDKLDTFYKANPDARSCAAVYETFSNQAVVEVQDDTTAYPWRDAKGNFMFQMSWPELGNPVEEPVNILAHELRQEIATTSGYPDLSVYVNYAHGDETLEQIYGKEKLPRLARLKKAWDPDNVFKYHHALPMDYS